MRFVRGRQALAAAGAILAGGGFLLGLPAERLRLEGVAAVLAVGFATLTGLAKQASP